MKIKNNVLIVGGSGFLGTNLIEKISKIKKYKIDTIIRNKNSLKRRQKNVRYLICDIRNSNQLKNFLKKNYNYVINLSGNINHKKNSETLYVHFYGLKNIIKYINKSELRLFIQIGSSLEYGNKKSPQNESFFCKPVSYYGKAKYKASVYIRKYLKDYLILRPYQIYGPYQKKNRLIPTVINQCLKGNKFPCTDGLQYRDFLYVDDFTNLILKILNKKKFKERVFNVGYGKPYTVKKIIKNILKLVKKGKPLFGKIKMRKDEIQKLYPSLRKLKKELNWQPKININSGLKKTISFYEKN